MPYNVLNNFFNKIESNMIPQSHHNLKHDSPFRKRI